MSKLHFQARGRGSASRLPVAPRRRQAARSGAATVELAICLPVIVILVLGSIESCSAIFLRQALVSAAYEGVRGAIHQDATNDIATARAEAVLEARKITGAKITFEPADVSQAPRGEYVTVKVQCNYQGRAFLPSTLLNMKKIRVEATMVKE